MCEWHTITCPCACRGGVLVPITSIKTPKHKTKTDLLLSSLTSNLMNFHVHFWDVRVARGANKHTMRW